MLLIFIFCEAKTENSVEKHGRGIGKANLMQLPRSQQQLPTLRCCERILKRLLNMNESRYELIIGLINALLSNIYRSSMSEPSLAVPERRPVVGVEAAAR